MVFSSSAPPMRAQSLSTNTASPTPAAFLPLPRTCPSKSAILHRTPRSSRHVLPVRPILRRFRPSKFVRNPGKLHSLYSPCLRRLAARRFQHYSQVLFCLKQRVLRSCFRDFQHSGNLSVPESFHFVEKKNVTLMTRQI